MIAFMAGMRDRATSGKRGKPRREDEQAAVCAGLATEFQEQLGIEHEPEQS